MIFKEFGDRQNKTVILLHGGGLSWWSCQPAAEKLQDTYHVVTPVIDGHGEDGGTLFLSIEDSAEKLIRYIDAELGGKVYAIGGLSLGAQITVEVLSRRSDIAEYAVIESALVFPLKLSVMTEWTFKISYGAISNRWFSKMQAASLCVPPEQFERYYEDSIKMTKQSLINMTKSNAAYALKDSFAATKAKALIIVGSKELGVMRRSAEKLRTALPGSTIYIAQDRKHGETSLVYTAAYTSLIRKFLEEPPV